MLFHRSRIWEPMPEQFKVLATYNSEVARGIVHTEVWKQRMALLQQEFGAWRDEQMAKDKQP